MKVPEDPACIAFSDGQEEAERHIKLLCTRLLLGWADLKPSDVQVSRISGGISNLLVKVDPPPSLQPVAVKVFGDKTELLIDRDAEKLLLLKLNDEGFGAPVIGLFGNGRIEGFLVAKTLTPEEMLDTRFVPHIARRLRTFHDLQIHAAAASSGAAAIVAVASPAADSPAMAPNPDVNVTPSAPAPSGGCSDSVSEPSSQWDAIYGWLAMAEGLSFAHDPAKQAAYDKVDFRAMRAELKALRKLCDRVRSPRVLCHNDLLSGNILVVQSRAQPHATTQDHTANGQSSCAEGLEMTGLDKVAIAGAARATPSSEEDVLEGGDLQFIDFEYSCYGPRGFDWGNHFNEYAGFDCVYERFPTPEQQKAFFRQYLKAGELQQLAEEYLWSQECATGQRKPNAPLDAAPGLIEEVGPGGALASAEEAVLDRLVAEACVFALASHAYWGVWSFIQARYSPIDFDYLEYSRMRWAEYYRRRAEFSNMVEQHFPVPH